MCKMFMDRRLRRLPQKGPVKAQSSSVKPDFRAGIIRYSNLKERVHESGGIADPPSLQPSVGSGSASCGLVAP